MAKPAKVYTILHHRRNRENAYKGTLPELIQMFSYTLDTGRSYQHEKGNRKINTQPRTVASLVSNLNAAKNNAAANGYCPDYYTLGE